MRIRAAFAGGLQFLVLAGSFVIGTEALAQAPATPESTSKESQSKTEPVTPQESDAPLPEIGKLMYQVEAHQKVAEAVRKDYLYHSVETQQERDGNGAVKKTTVKEYDVFWIGGVPVAKLVRKDGRDLTPDEQKKESERIDKDVAKAQQRKDKGDEKGKETSPRGNDMITVSRFLELGSFTHPRRVKLEGRDTIVVDYAGNPKAKTRNRAEDVVRDLVGTIWIDEQDKVIRKTEGHFLNAFKIGAGLVVNIRKDTSFGLDQTKVNGEVWLPRQIQAQGAARALLLFSFNGSILVQMSDYRKFKATSTILPGVSTVEEGADGASGANGVSGSSATPPQ
jgi:hypothetical protein